MTDHFDRLEERSDAGAGAPAPTAADADPAASPSAPGTQWALHGQPDDAAQGSPVPPSDAPTLPSPGAPSPVWNPPTDPGWGGPVPATPGSQTQPGTPGSVPPSTPYPPGSGGGGGGATPASGAHGRRSWIVVAVVAAVIGGGVGAGVSALASDNNASTPSTLTIKEGSAAPGAAVLSGNVSIPQLVSRVSPAVVSIDVKSPTAEDQGTGMIISSNGEVVTNNHVISLAEAGGAITVTESGATKSHPASLVGTDPSSDVALLRIKGASGLPTITFGNSDKAVVGDAVVAIGNALALAAGTPTVTQGIVSALGRTVTAGDSSSSASETLTNMIQTDAAINSGNSGGPLIDTSGQVIGMNTAVAGSTSDGTNAQNIGFAIPASTIESLLPKLQKGGTARNSGGALGVTAETLNAQLRQQYGFTPQSGAVVLSVLSGSPADQAGIQQGDVIVAVDSTPIASAEQLASAISGHHAGTTVQVTYYTGNQKHTKSITLESQSAEQQQEQQAQSGISGGLGGSGSGGSGGSGGLIPFP